MENKSINRSLIQEYTLTQVGFCRKFHELAHLRRFATASNHFMNMHIL